MFATVLIIAMLVTMVFLFLFMIRNTLVFRHRMKKINIVSNLATRDIYAGNENWRRWYDILESVNYYEMVWKFWRRLDSFYPPELRDK